MPVPDPLELGEPDIPPAMTPLLAPDVDISGGKNKMYSRDYFFDF